MWSKFVSRILSAGPRKRLTGRTPYPGLTPGHWLSCRWVFRGDEVPKTGEIALYILENCEWDWREVAFPSLRLPDDYQDLCPDFDLSQAKEAAQDFLLPEIPQVTFCAMLLNDAVRLGVLSRGMIEILELDLVELRWSTFEEWLWCSRGNILRASRSEPDSDREESSELMHLPHPVALAMSSGFSFLVNKKTVVYGEEEEFREGSGQDHVISTCGIKKRQAGIKKADTRPAQGGGKKENRWR
ncbi:hypothetical protein Cgig2_011550 [Carnegiea gigantea]|uniref:Uncharacterized protein n=1 Tax=Carnegiea gigantea TaxID=171969 RepID=A0A9Q1GX01_9CARY|nr:hypothetical protein Cgig2_011550 [Carnegiea gigantea]